MAKRIQAITTQRCNSNCSYCMVSRCGKDMSQKTIDGFPNIVKKYDRDVLMLFGGEPLLREDICDQLMSGFDGKIMIPTNGILLQEKHLDKFANILISSNGTPETCELTGQVHVPHIRDLSDKSHCTIGMRITPASVRRMKEDFLYFHLSGFKKYNIVPIIEMDWTDEDLMEYEMGVRFIVSHINREQVWTWTKGGICVPFRGTMCVDQDGGTWACARYFESKIRVSENLSIDNFTFCMKCALRPYCFHNCNYLNITKNGSLFYPYKTICKFAKVYKGVFDR